MDQPQSVNEPHDIPNFFPLIYCFLTSDDLPVWVCTGAARAVSDSWARLYLGPEYRRVDRFGICKELRSVGNLLARGVLMGDRGLIKREDYGWGTANEVRRQGSQQHGIHGIYGVGFLKWHWSRTSFTGSEKIGTVFLNLSVVSVISILIYQLRWLGLGLQRRIKACAHGWSLFTFNTLLS